VPCYFPVGIKLRAHQRY